jgi:glycerophosphoryl diester phosphodiesterase
MTAKHRIEAMYSNHPTLVWGHRGACAYAPMNTLPSFELAVEQGADGVELDVHRTKDGHIVVVHDFTVDATTDGEGSIKDMTLNEIKELDAGNWFDEKFAGTKIPTLNEVFEAIGQKLYINIEIKSHDIVSDGIEQAVAECIQRHNLQEQILVSSFNPLTLRRFREQLPEIPIGYAYATGYMRQLQSLLGNLKYEARHPNHESVDAESLEMAKNRDYVTATWTVNDPRRAKELVALGVEGIITDNPDTIIQAIR